MDGKRVLWIPHTSWRNPQRARVLLEALSASNEAHAITNDYELTRPRDIFSLEYLRSYMPRQYVLNEVSVAHVPKISPAIPFRRIRQLNSRMMLKKAQRLIDELQLDNVIGSYLCPPPRCRQLLFDVFDPNPELWIHSSRPFKDYAAEIAATEKAYMEKADRVIAASTILALLRNGRGDIEVLPNGVDLKKYSKINRRQCRDALGVHDSKVLVYSGLLNDLSEAKLLYESHKLISKRVDAILVLAGAGQGYDWILSRAKKDGKSRIHFLGLIPSEDVPSVLCGADVGLCPYQRFRSSWIPGRVLNQLKLLAGPILGGSMKIVEYSAASLPVVCTNQIVFRKMEFDNIEFTGYGAKEFAHGIQRALDTPFTRPSLLEEYDLPLIAGRFEKILI